MAVIQRPITHDRHLIKGGVPTLSLFRGALPGEPIIVAKQYSRYWTLEPRRGDTIATHDARLAEVADR
ncbi:MAG: hypothetical protein HY067_22770 [Betaproteobacteria bacterium]|nr:hypothetical protein [Betaproteobacteria bacterium]